MPANTKKQTLIPFPGAPQPPPPEEKIKRRPDGLYQLEKRYTLPDGTKKKKSFYGKSQTEVSAKRRAFERELDQGINVQKRDVKIKDYASNWIVVHKANVSVNTRKTYQHDVDLLISHCGDMRLRDATLSDMQAIVNTRAGLSKSAIKKTAMTLRAVFEAARADRIITFNPCDKLVLPDAKDGTHRAITEFERDLITNQCQDHDFHLAAMLMLYAGLRRGEVMALNIARDVDFSAKTIHIREAVHHDGNKAVLGDPKSEASIRTIPIMPPLLPLLQKHKSAGLAIHKKNGEHLTSSSFKSKWKSYLYHLEIHINGARKRWADEKQLANWKTFPVRCLDLRHSFCSMLYDAGVDVKTAQQWMGHADIMVTMRIYTHLSSTKQEAAIKTATKHFEQYVGKNVGKPSSETT